MAVNTKILSEKDLHTAAEIIKAGGLVVFPTETVYGIGANALLDSAVERIFAAKNRPADNPLIIHLADVEQAERYAVTTDSYYRLAEKFMPGALTVILQSRGAVSSLVTAGLDTVAVRVPQNSIAKRLIELSGVPIAAGALTVILQSRGAVSSLVTAGLDTVAVRVPQNSIAKRLIELSGVPIAAPSANISGRPSATRAEHIFEELSGRVDAIIDSTSSDIGLESTVVMLSAPPMLLRPGAVSPEQLRAILPDLEISSGVEGILAKNEVVRSPGLHYRHYAPRAKCRLIIGAIAPRGSFARATQSNIARP